MKFTAGSQCQCFMCTVLLSGLQCQTSQDWQQGIYDSLCFGFALIFFCFCCLGKQGPTSFSSFLQDVGLFDKHIQRTVSTQAISSVLQCLVHLWSCTTMMMMMAQLDSWKHDFLGEMVGMSLEKGLHAIFSHLPMMHLGQKKVRGRENPWRTTGG